MPTRKDTFTSGRVRLAAIVVVLADAVMLYSALILMFQIEPTDEALRESAKGKAVATLVLPSVIAAVLALVGSGQRWGRHALVVAALCALVAAGVLALV
ncbi:MAG: hypothetical protein ACR2FV_03740 [Ornithinimicrobium sp.]|uniref:hypothetical protein n=1 Tax=Ornithinimicrobium sp. TaxID=1977084 RepID=UPI003D9B7527